MEVLECSLFPSSFSAIPIHTQFNRTPLYQLLTHALPDKANKTKFKLIYANVSEDDILLRKELDELKKKYPNTFDILYLVDKPNPGWAGGVGYVNNELIKQNFGASALKEKVKIFVCGEQ